MTNNYSRKTQSPLDLSIRNTGISNVTSTTKTRTTGRRTTRRSNTNNDSNSIRVSYRRPIRTTPQLTNDSSSAPKFERKRNKTPSFSKKEMNVYGTIRKHKSGTKHLLGRNKNDGIQKMRNQQKETRHLHYYNFNQPVPKFILREEKNYTLHYIDKRSMITLEFTYHPVLSIKCCLSDMYKPKDELDVKSDIDSDVDSDIDSDIEEDEEEAKLPVKNIMDHVQALQDRADAYLVEFRQNWHNEIEPRKKQFVSKLLQQLERYLLSQFPTPSKEVSQNQHKVFWVQAWEDIVKPSIQINSIVMKLLTFYHHLHLPSNVKASLVDSNPFFLQLSIEFDPITKLGKQLESFARHWGMATTDLNVSIRFKGIASSEPIIHITSPRVHYLSGNTTYQGRLILPNHSNLENVGLNAFIVDIIHHIQDKLEINNLISSRYDGHMALNELRSSIRLKSLAKMHHSPYKKEYVVLNLNDYLLRTADYLSGKDIDIFQGGNKILLPKEDDAELIPMVRPNSVLTFCLTNGTRRTFVGVKEFRTPPGVIVLPNWIIEYLYHPKKLQIEQIPLEPGTHMVLQAHSIDFNSAPNNRQLLEFALRKFSCISEGMAIPIPYGNQIHRLQVISITPQPAAVVVGGGDMTINAEVLPAVDFERTYHEENKEDDIDEDDEEEPLLPNHERCDRCRKSIPIHAMTMHGIQCQRVYTPCLKCSKYVHHDQMQDHLKMRHSETNCKQCGIKVEKSKMKRHLDWDCSQRMKHCKFCEVPLHYAEVETHEQVCASLTRFCTDCQTYIQNKDWQQHTINCQIATTTTNIVSNNVESSIVNDEEMARNLQAYYDNMHNEPTHLRSNDDHQHQNELMSNLSLAHQQLDEHLQHRHQEFERPHSLEVAHQEAERRRREEQEKADLELAKRLSMEADFEFARSLQD